MIISRFNPALQHTSLLCQLLGCLIWHQNNHRVECSVRSGDATASSLVPVKLVLTGQHDDFFTDFLTAKKSQTYSNF